MTGEILFLAHRTPYPPDRGDKIRSWHVLKALAALAPVHVGCLAENGEDLAHEHVLADLADSLCMPLRAKPLPQAGVEGLFSGKPISLTAFADAELRRWVRRVLAERPIETTYVFSGQMGQYVPDGFSGRVVMDLVDVDSAKFDAYAEECRFPLSWIYKREGRRLARVEQRLTERADMTLLVSEAEAGLLRDRVGTGGEIRALCNGIDCTMYDPKELFPSDRIARSPGPRFVFTGQMDYAPNEKAVARFARNILPAIREQHPEAHFHIVGRSPTPAVQSLELQPGVIVWGEVPDTRPFLAAADIVVAPLTIARGIQNKVLEAMAMGRPVLLSPQAATGIDAEHGEQFVICDNDELFAKHALTLLDRPETMREIGSAARRFVCERMSWHAMLADMPEILGMPTAKAEQRNAA